MGRKNERNMRNNFILKQAVKKIKNREEDRDEREREMKRGEREVQRDERDEKGR